jgi:hypothetical protein
MVEERFAKMEEFGEEWDKPVCELILLPFSSHCMVESKNDMLMWLMSEAKGVERSVEAWQGGLLGDNFAAIHSTSQASESAGIPAPNNAVLTIAYP